MAEAVERGRDRAGTEAALMAAARAVLAEQGFRGLGVNAVARTAGCDKQLIYRYFGGLDGLIDRMGADLSDWVERALRPGDGPPRDYADLAERLLVGYMRALRADPMMRRILAWEAAEDSPAVRRLAEARSRGLAAWIARERGALEPPQDVDAAASNALLVGAVQQAALAGAASGQFAGLPLGAPEDWERAEAALRALVRGVYRRG